MLAKCACEGPLPAGRDHVWVEPQLVCEVRYKEWTEEGLLRQPVFLRFRDDKAPHECRFEDVPAGRAGEAEAGAAAHGRARGSRRPSHEPGQGVLARGEYTKGDLIGFYREVAPWLLPYLKDRPLVLTRYPDGIAGKSFYQKDAPDFVPAWIRKFRVFSEHTDRDIEYFVCDDAETLVYLANLGTIPLHVWSSRVNAIQQPDWCILDLDPKGAPFAHVIELARLIKRLADEVSLPALCKTSGASGLHVLIPLGAQCTYEQSRSLAQLLAFEVDARARGHRDHRQVAARPRGQGLRGLPAERATASSSSRRSACAPCPARPSRRPCAGTKSARAWTPGNSPSAPSLRDSRPRRRTRCVRSSTRSRTC